MVVTVFAVREMATIAPVSCNIMPLRHAGKGHGMCNKELMFNAL